MHYLCQPSLSGDLNPPQSGFPVKEAISNRVSPRTANRIFQVRSADKMGGPADIAGDFFKGRTASSFFEAPPG